MATEYKLPYTASDINIKLGTIDKLSEDVNQLSSQMNDYKNDIPTEVENQLDGAKADIVTEILSQLGGMPVFGTINDNNTITVTSNLVDGDYVLMYENEDGTISQICTFTVGNGEPEIINWIPESVNADGTPFVGTNGEDGYTTGLRISSSGTESSATMCTSGYIPFVSGQTVYLKDITPNGANIGYIACYDEDKKFIQVYAIEDQFTKDENGVYSKQLNASSFRFIRLCASVIDNASILSLDKEIE